MHIDCSDDIPPHTINKSDDRIDLDKIAIVLRLVPMRDPLFFLLFYLFDLSEVRDFDSVVFDLLIFYHATDRGGRERFEAVGSAKGVQEYLHLVLAHVGTHVETKPLDLGHYLWVCLSSPLGMPSLGTGVEGLKL